MTTDKKPMVLSLELVSKKMVLIGFAETIKILADGIKSTTMMNPNYIDSFTIETYLLSAKEYIVMAMKELEECKKMFGEGSAPKNLMEQITNLLKPIEEFKTVLEDKKTEVDSYKTELENLLNPNKKPGGNVN